ncbi:MAG: radical SAM protein, partial [Deltaproteobacteria bacterium]|nr:radical SAM protein [Deltaproteobacteria bacterium]
ELRAMISELDVSSRVCFDHAGNHWRNAKGGLLFTLDYEGYSFPEQKRLVLDLIEEGIRIH